ncbi:MAG TPA: hypothetical protein VIH91_12480 [Terriglobales bacterium]
MLTDSAEREYLKRIETALMAANAVAGQFVAGTFEVKDRGGRDVITDEVPARSGRWTRWRFGPVRRKRTSSPFCRWVLVPLRNAADSADTAGGSKTHGPSGPFSAR